MQLRFLLDEDVERELAIKLRRAGHDVERVVEVDTLGTGAADAEVRAYARRTNRILVTHDADHDAAEASTHAGVFYCPNQRLSSFEVFRIVQQVVEQYPDRDHLPGTVYLTEAWLRE